MTWYVMRDLKRANALKPAYMHMAEAGFRVYTPMVWKLVSKGGEKERKFTPAVHGLLFIESDRSTLDPYVDQIPTLQYQFARGAVRTPMEIDSTEMERFIAATTDMANPIYLTPDEILPSMIGKRVEITDGPLKGLQTNLTNVKGRQKKRIFVAIPGVITATVEIDNKYFKLL